MCGIAGFISPSTSNNLASNAQQMIEQLYYRGPDDNGVWTDDSSGIALAHSRLAIVDLSPAGHQPMESHNHRYVLVFNGEIYNHNDIRADLEDKEPTINWRGHSDTETLVAGFSAWGVEATIKKTTGMFAFAVWDKQTKTLTMGRDRLGEKPLYYGWQGESFFFGSELKALKAHPAFKAEIDRDALTLFLRHNYVPEPYSIYKGIAKLPAGCLLTLKPNDKSTKITQFWSAIAVAKAGVETPFEGSPTQAVDELEVRLGKAVKQQMMADVPLGAFLSGGVDSSTIVALMQSQSSRPVNTFTIGFDVPNYNEATHAKTVAEHLGTNHTELYISASTAMDVIPDLPTIYDEPFADESQIPTFLVSKMAKEHVTVSLSGDGGDELFCGYNRYHITAKSWGKLSPIPQSIRQVMATGLTSLSPTTWTKLSQIIPENKRPQLLGDKIHKGAGVLASHSIQDLYKGLTSTWKDPAALVIGATEPDTLLTGNSPNLEGLRDIERMMLLDVLTYLPDDILAKVDRAAMRNSLETRVPMLNHDVVKFAWQLPIDYKLRNGVSKWPLREVLYRHVPKSMIERPKMGFSVPIADWLREPLHDWAETLLAESRLREEGYFNVDIIRTIWKEHLSGQFDHSQRLWSVLMFQAWLEKQ
ncbi:MAG: asparagine synthase (glutamine-hydrolyzing) [Cocleimonas sp.]